MQLNIQFLSPTNHTSSVPQPRSANGYHTDLADRERFRHCRTFYQTALPRVLLIRGQPKPSHIAKSNSATKLAPQGDSTQPLCSRIHPCNGPGTHTPSVAERSTVQSKTPTHLQHCFFIFRPPNLGLSKQLVQTPQSSGTWQPGHCPHRLDRRPFFTGGS